MEIDARKTKKVLNYLLSEGKIPFFVAKLIFSRSYALAANQSNEEELVKNAFFSLFAGLHQRVNHQGAIWIKFRDHSCVFRQSLKNWPLWRCDFGCCGRAFVAVAVVEKLKQESLFGLSPGTKWPSNERGER